MKRKDENRIFRSAMLRRFIWISAVLSLLILILAVSIMLLLETEVLHFLPALALMAFLCFLICCMFIAASLSFFRRLSELLSGIRRLAEGEPVHMYEEGIISELAKGLNQASEIQTRQKRMLEKTINGLPPAKNYSLNSALNSAAISAALAWETSIR